MEILATPWVLTALVAAAVFVVLGAAYSFAKFELLMRAARSGSADIAPHEGFQLQIARRLGIGSNYTGEFCVLLLEPCMGGPDAERIRSLAGLLRGGVRKSDDVLPYDELRIGAILDVPPGRLETPLRRWRAIWTRAMAEAGMRSDMFAGLAVYPDDAESADGLMTAAEEALERARAEGPRHLHPFGRDARTPEVQADGEPHAAEAGLIDPLTGILRVERTHGAARKFLARGRRMGHPVTVMHIDIDRMQDINDRFGRDVGDQMLKELGGILSREVRETDLIGRAGGDDFLALVECNVSDAVHVADRLIERTRAVGIRAGVSVIRFTVSIGIAGPTEEGIPPHLLEAAETAMLVARREGQNVYCIYRRAMGIAPQTHHEGQDVF